MKLYATFLFLWLALIAALVGYVGLYKAVAQASTLAFEEPSPVVASSISASDDDRLRRYVVSPDALPSFTQELIARAKAVGVSASVTAEPASDVRFFRFTLSADGDFNAVMRAVGVVEYAPYILSVDSLTAGVGPTGIWHSEMTFSVGSQTVL